MALVETEIDGRKIQVERDRSALDVAREQGAKIPTLCHHPALSSYGSCRLCVVEVSKRGESWLAASCDLPIREGLSIRTDSPAVIAARKMTLELLWAQAPDAVEIQALARELGYHHCTCSEHVAIPTPVAETRVAPNPLAAAQVAKRALTWVRTWSSVAVAGQLIPARGSLVRSILELFPAVTAVATDYVTVESDIPIGGLEYLARGEALCAMLGVAASGDEEQARGLTQSLRTQTGAFALVLLAYSDPARIVLGMAGPDGASARSLRYASREMNANWSPAKKLASCGSP